MVKKIYLGGTIVTLLGLFLALSQIYGVHIETSGDTVCSNECISYFNITSENYTIYVRNPNQIKLQFSPEIQDFQVYRLKYNDWVPVDVTNFNFNKGVTYQFKIIAHKNSKDTVKWSLSYSDKEIDPTWIGSSNVIKYGNDLVPDFGERFWNASGEYAESPYYPAIILNQTNYIDRLISWEFDEINETHWQAQFTINQTFWNNTKNCIGKSTTCWNNLKNHYFPNSTSAQIKADLLNMVNYKRTSFTDNIEFSNLNFDSAGGTGNFLIIFPDGFKIGEEFKLGFNSTYGYTEYQTTQSTTTTGFKDVMALTITGTDAGNYIVLAEAETTESTASYVAKVNMSIDGTLWGYSAQQPMTASTEWNPISWIKNVTFGAGETHIIRLGLATGSASYTASIRNIHAFVLKPTDGYYYNENETVGYVGPVKVNKLWLNFTPPTSAPYLILASFEGNTTATTAELWVNLTVNSIDNDTLEYTSGAAEIRAFGLMNLLNFSNSPQSIAINAYQNYGAQSYAMRRIRLAAIPLGSYTYYFNRSESESTTTSISYVDKLVLTPTLLNASYVVIGSSETAESSSTYFRDVALYFNTAIHNDEYERPKQTTNYFNGIFLKQVNPSGAGGDVTKIQFKTSSASGTAKIRNARLLIFKAPAPTVPDIKITFNGLTTKILFNQPDICDERAMRIVYPENQTTIMGVINGTNNGTASANNFEFSLSSSPPTNYTFYIGNYTHNITIPDTAWYKIYATIPTTQNRTFLFYINCSYPTSTWQPNFQFRAT